MGLKQDIAGAEVYIARAHRRIRKHCHLIEHSPRRHTVGSAREVVDVLTILLLNVEQQYQRMLLKTQKVRKSSLNS